VKKGRRGRCLSILSPALWLEFGVADLIYVSFFTPRAGRLAIGAKVLLTPFQQVYDVRTYICGNPGKWVASSAGLCAYKYAKFMRMLLQVPRLSHTKNHKNSKQNDQKFALFTWLTN